MFLRFLKIMLPMCLAGIILTACNFYSGDKGGNSNNYKSLNKVDMHNSSRMYGSNQPGGTVIHNNRKLMYSRELSNILSNIPGVRAAIVMLTEQNAYTAILIDNAISGTRGIGSIKETDHSSSSLNTYNPHSPYQAVENWRLATGVNNYETVQHQEDITRQFKQKIAVTLRKANPLIYEVYISANRDFVNQLTAYAIDSGWGETSLNDRVGEFNQTANRLFGVPEILLEATNH